MRVSRWMLSPSRLRREWQLAALLLLGFLAPSCLALSSADYYVHSLPGQPEGDLLKMHAGTIEVTPEHHGNLFFWHFQNRHLANRHRTVIWLNGGPGCSSMDGALMEVGPYRLKDQEHLVYNEGSWDEFSNLLFIDNPVGTGFSYVDSDSYIHELTTMADNMVVFLQKFFEIFPEYEDNEIYLAGESYAGQHIPYIAQAILERNKKPNAHSWQLKGLLIGNGWIAPNEQSHAYLDFAYKANLVTKGSSIANKLEAQRAICVDELKKGSHVSYPGCEQILQEILKLTVKDARCVNMYDVRLDDTYPACGMNWPPDLKYITPYLRRADVMKALHVDRTDKKTGWTECNNHVGSAFRTTKSPPAIELLPRLLDSVPVLLFSGDKDLICNHVGTEELIHNMRWAGGQGFELSPGTWAPRRDWTFEGEPAGLWQAARNLTYVLFYNSSHMVPFDYPRRTRDMLDRFTGVDIASIGGAPADSRLDGQKGLQTSVGGHANSSLAELAELHRLEAERWAAYRRSGVVALAVVSVLAAAFAWYVWRDRRRRAGYRGLLGGERIAMMSGRRGMGGRAGADGGGDDVEAVDFDESELDDFGVGGDDDDDDSGGGHGGAKRMGNGYGK